MTRRFSLLVCLALLFIPGVTQAQTTFTVTVEAKTDDHPYNGQGFPEGYAIDGDQGAELTLARGETYEFQMDGVSSFHPFFITTSAEGGPGAPVWEEGVTGNGASGNAVLTFTVPMDAPDLLWYQCMNHERMGWRLNIVNPVANEDDAQPLALELSAAFPNPFAEQTTLTLSLTEPQEVTVEVFDVVGRRVATLHDGMLSSGREHAFTLGAAGLPDGTYIVRVWAREHTVERRVTLMR